MTEVDIKNDENEQEEDKSEISIKETTELIAQLMGKKVDISLDPQRIRPKDSEVERLWASNAKAKKLLNWQPTFKNKDGLANGLKKTIEWFYHKENLKNYKTELYNI